jgi:hypothetical protein
MCSNHMKPNGMSACTVVLFGARAQRAHGAEGLSAFAMFVLLVTIVY